MTSLTDINREEWANQPYLLELHGGPGDGRRFTWPTLPFRWRELVHRPIGLADYKPDAHVVVPIGPPTAEYRQTGSVTDDGAHIYAFDRLDQA
jgi:hypothetical protein